MMEECNMKNQVVVVTGGGRGIGRAIAERFAGAGARIVVAARSNPELEETRQSIEAGGGKCHIRVADVAAPDDVRTLIDDTAKLYGRLDVLVNNAGIAPQASLENLDASLFEMVHAVNIAAVFHACRAAWSLMKKQGGGVIVNISSVASVDPFPGFAAYGASKAWVNAWTKGLAEEGRACGIRVFAVAPGAVETRMLRDAFPDFPKDQTLRPENVADVVFALAQIECRYATGQTVFVRR